MQNFKKMTRTDVINYLIEEYGFKSYLEIGTQTKSQNFDKIQCDVKYCVDSDAKSEADFIMTSDEYFDQCNDTFDLIFIDGDHSENQSMKDFQNACGCLNSNGVIVMHDTLPDNEDYTKPEWCGEVYKTALELSSEFLVKTMNADHGVSVFYPDSEFEGREVPLNHYDLDSIKFYLNSVNSLHDVKDISINDVFINVEQSQINEPILYSDMSDEDFIKEWKSKTGRKRLPKGGFNREKLIEDLA